MVSEPGVAGDKHKRLSNKDLFCSAPFLRCRALSLLYVELIQRWSRAVCACVLSSGVAQETRLDCGYFWLYLAG